MNSISKKICLVGDFGVGKTSLVRRFVDGVFSDQYLSTVGVKISRKSVEVPAINDVPACNLQLLIWDIEGQTKFKAIAPSYLQGATATILVADATRPETIENLSTHIQLFRSVNQRGLVTVALNKTDLIEQSQLVFLLKEKHLENIQSLGIYPTSAKTGLHVEELFQVLATKICNSLSQ